MADSFTPLVTAAQLGVYINDPTINVERANDILEDAQLLCEAVVNPLPPSATVVIKRVASRAYMNPPRPVSPIPGVAAPLWGIGTFVGGVFLLPSDKEDLLDMAGNQSGVAAVYSVPLATGWTDPVVSTAATWP
jgi:hypothetical protein